MRQNGEVKQEININSITKIEKYPLSSTKRYLIIECNVERWSTNMSFHSDTRAGRSHILRFQRRSCSTIFESGFGSDIFWNLDPTPVQTPATIDATKIQQFLNLRKDIYKYHTDTCTAENEKTPDPGPKKTQNSAGVDSGTPNPWPCTSVRHFFIIDL